MAMTEQQVQMVIAAQGGDMKEFEGLYAAYYEKVYGFVRMILKNESEAEDVLQETFVTAWRKLGTLESPQAFSVWIQVIAKNLCNMQLRRKNLAILLDADQDIENFDTEEESAEFLPAAYAERADLKERFGRVLDSLSDVQRQAVTLYYFNELSVDEISSIMECSANTVKTRLFLARKAIRAEVEEQERKTGQKFFGVAGIPMMPLGGVVKEYMGSISMGQGAADATLNAIAKSISEPAGAETAVETQIAEPTEAEATAETQITEPAGAEVTDSAGAAEPQSSGAGNVGAGAAEQAADQSSKTATGLPLKAKIAAGVSAAVVVAIIIAFVVIPAASGGAGTGGDGQAGGNGAADPGEAYEPDGDAADNGPGGDAADNGQNDGAADGGQDGGVADGGTPADAAGGGVVYDYNDLSTAVADIPRKEALDEMYILLEGYWITGGNPFVGFFINGNGEHEIEYGLFQSSFGARGIIVDGHATGTYEATLTLFIPAVPENAMDDARPERTETIHIDIGGLYQDSTIKVKIENQDVSGWNTYEAGGYTLQQAFENWAG